MRRPRGDLVSFSPVRELPASSLGSTTPHIGTREKLRPELTNNRSTLRHSCSIPSALLGGNIPKELAQPFGSVFGRPESCVFRRLKEGGVWQAIETPKRINIVSGTSRFVLSIGIFQALANIEKHFQARAPLPLKIRPRLSWRFGPRKHEETATRQHSVAPKIKFPQEKKIYPELHQMKSPL